MSHLRATQCLISAAKKFVLLMLGLALHLGSANAQTFSLTGEREVPVAVHIKKPSSFKLSGTTDMRELLSRLGAPEAKISKMPRNAPTLGIEYQGFRQNLPMGAGTFDGKPKCETSTVRRNPVLVDTEELKYFDMVYYDYKEASETRKSEAWPLPTVPFLEGDLYNPYRIQTLQQELGRFLDIRCLPTRIHYPVVDGERIEEYREGARAWDPDPR